MTVEIITVDSRSVLQSLSEQSINCCVTSPPYFGLRDYGVDGQIGLEQTPDEYVAEMVSVFREVHRILRNDGTLWLNLGDSYAAQRGGTHQPAETLAGGVGGKADDGGRVNRDRHDGYNPTRNASAIGLKHKDLIGIPWRVAFALQSDGWYLRQWLPWVKRNPMPESVQDRPTSACETVFMLTKSPRYFFDYEAVRRHMAPASAPRLAQNIKGQAGSSRANGGAKTNGSMKAVGKIDKQRGHSRRHDGFNDRWDKMTKEERRGERALRNSDLFYDSLESPHGAIFNSEEYIALDVATQPFREAHFAVMPSRLAEPLIRASCPEGGTVLDPFGGAGTTGLVADRMGRNAVLLELNSEYAEIAKRRIESDGAMFADVRLRAA